MESGVESPEPRATRRALAQSTLIPALDRVSYPFPKSYQQKLLAILLNDRQALPKYVGLIRPSHFTTPLYRDMAGVLMQVFTQTKTVPSVEALEVVIREEIKRRGPRLPDDVGAAWLVLLQDLAQMRVFDAKLITNQVMEWIQDRAADAMLVEMGSIRDLAERTGERQHHRYMEIVRAFNQIGVSNVNDTIHYFDEVQQRMTGLFLDEAQYGLRVPLLLSSIDPLIDGGPLLRDLVVWAAPTGRGKTYALVWVTKTALYQGKKVLFITCEMVKNSIAARVDRCVTHFTKEDMKHAPLLTMERINTLKTYRGDLIIVEMMGKRATVQNIQNEIERLKAEEGFHPDVICVDYPGRMHGVERYAEREKRHELASIYSDLQVLGRDYNAVMHVPMQTNKGSLSKAVITLKDIAECYEVAWMAELILTMCRTRAEEREGLMRFFIGKNREGLDHWAAPYKFNRFTGNFIRAGDALHTPDGADGEIEYGRTEETNHGPSREKRSASG